MNRIPDDRREPPPLPLPTGAAAALIGTTEPKLADTVRAFAAMTAAHRGEATADVTSAHPLAADQVTALKAKLKSRLGRDVAVNLNVDPAILGGLIVKVGSRLVDSSIRTRLNTLATAMKG